MAETKEKKKIPVTILTGFLGSGKTTLLNHILSANHGKKLAVVENEFGETGVDEEVLLAKEHSQEVVVEVKNGCICCTVRGDLVEALGNIYKKTKGNLDGLIIETTGLADPAPVCQSFFVEDSVFDRFEIDAVVTIVDAKHIIQHLDEKKPEGVENEAVEQLAFADRIFINKIDLVSAEELEKVQKRISTINKYAPQFKTQFSKEPPNMDQILGLNAFSLDRATSIDEGFLNTDEEHIHDQRVSSIGFSLGPDQQIHVHMLSKWIQEIIKKYAVDLYRYKGVIAVKGFDQKYVFQGVHMFWGGSFASDWKDQERKSVFCFIGKDLDKIPIKEGFEKCIVKPLRYAVGDRVEVNLEADYWADGTIESLWDGGNAYQVKIDKKWGGFLHDVAIDDSEYIKMLKNEPVKRKAEEVEKSNEETQEAKKQKV